MRKDEKLFIAIVFVVISLIAVWPMRQKKDNGIVRIYWRQGQAHDKKDYPITGKVYWIFTRTGVFYFDDTKGDIFKLTNWKNICPEDRQLVKDNLEELASRYDKKK